MSRRAWRVIELHPRDAFFSEEERIIGTVVYGNFVPTSNAELASAGFMCGPMDQAPADDKDARFFAAVKLEEEEHEISTGALHP